MDNKVFYIEGFGEVGEANMLIAKIVKHISGPQWFDLEVGQSCDLVTKDGSERVTRIK